MRGQGVEALALYRAVDDRNVRVAERIAGGAADMRIGGQLPGDRHRCGLSGKRQHVLYVGIAHGDVGTKGRGVFRLPVAQAHGGGEVGLQRSAREHAVVYGRPGLGGVEVAREARERPSFRAEVGDQHVAGDVRSAQLSAGRGGHGGCSTGVEFDRQISRQGAEIRQIARDRANLNALAERARDIDPRVRQREVGFRQRHGVGAAVIVHIQLSRHRHAAPAGCDAKVRARHHRRGILQAALRLHRSGNDAVVPQRFSQKCACQFGRYRSCAGCRRFESDPGLRGRQRR